MGTEKHDLLIAPIKWNANRWDLGEVGANQADDYRGLFYAGEPSNVNA
ncbi:hypothetical protein [Photorhabdus noenieputensis]|nr:hypothetical protein [Photorhabdus noenieputensis]MCK3668659.1 hypothetical protein [Photorhabdus noenieputensis]